MSEPIGKITDRGIGSDYDSGQVYWFRCWKILVFIYVTAQWVSEGYIITGFLFDSVFRFFGVSVIIPNSGQILLTNKSYITLRVQKRFRQNGWSISASNLRGALRRRGGTWGKLWGSNRTLRRSRAVGIKPNFEARERRLRQNFFAYCNFLASWNAVVSHITRTRRPAIN